MKYIALALCLLACQDSKSNKPPPPAPTVAANQQREACVVSLALFERLVGTGDPNITTEQLTKVKIAVLDRCEHDRWSQPALACMSGARTGPDLMKCWADLLTKEQRDAASKALEGLNM
jgi:hypothetical protein